MIQVKGIIPKPYVILIPIPRVYIRISQKFENITTVSLYLEYIKVKIDEKKVLSNYKLVVLSICDIIIKKTKKMQHHLYTHSIVSSLSFLCTAALDLLMRKYKLFT